MTALVRLKKLVVEGLFSYSERQSIEFLDRVVIVGPNNGGKSNLFRIIDILADALSSPSGLSDSQVSESAGNPSIEAEISLSPGETGMLADFLACGYNDEKDSTIEMIAMPNTDKAAGCLDSAVIKLGWEKNPDGSAGSPTVEIRFPKCGLVCKGELVGSSLDVVTARVPYDETGSGHVQLNEVMRTILQADDPKEAAESFLKSNRAIHHPVDFDAKRIDAESRPKVTALTHRLNSAGGAISLPRLFGIILGRIVHATENRNLLQDEVKETFERLFLRSYEHGEFETKYNRALLDRLEAHSLAPTDALENDGRNIAQLLFSLKNSPRRSDTERYDAIKGRFERLFSDQRLTIEPIVEYPVVDPPLDHSVRFPQTRLVIADKNLSRHLPLGQVGAGARGVIYLLTAVYGAKDSVVMLDEPGINLHPTMLQKVMNIIDEQDSGNQILVITHSPDLLRHEMARKGTGIVRVGNSNGQSRICQDADRTGRDPRGISHTVDAEVFFAKLAILVEGESDRAMLGLADRMAVKEPKYDLPLNNIAVVGVCGKYGFEGCRKLLDKYCIPWIILADEDAKDRFKPDEVSWISKDGVEGDGPVFLLKGDLEKFMEDADPDTFEEFRHKTKVARALEWAGRTLEKNPDGASLPVAEFLDRCLSAAGRG